MLERYDDRQSIRSQVKVMLENVPNGQRIHLDKDLVEKLLFEVDNLKATVSDGTKDIKYESKCKFVVWSGSFLQKLDLSEISFDDVMWDVIYDGWGIFENNDVYHYSDTKIIDLSNTNAKIDFSKSYYSKLKLETKIENFDLHIDGCNFENVDLSNNTLGEGECDYACENVNFSNTGIKINLDSAIDYFNVNTFPPFFTCNFSGLDFSKYTLSANFVTYGDNVMDKNTSCDYSNTGLNIHIDSEDVTWNNELEEQKKCLFDLIKDGRLTGCYVDGIKVESCADYIKFIYLIDDADERNREELLSSIYDDVNSQINKESQR